MSLTAAEMIEAVRRAHPQAAVVPEVTIHDHLWDERRSERKPFRRIDALMFKSFQRTAIEVKVSLPDWKRDSWSKRAPWAAVVHRFVYVVPKELHEAVDGKFGPLGLDVYRCGIWTVDDRGNVQVARKALITPHPEQLPQQVVQLLGYRAAGIQQE